MDIHIRGLRKTYGRSPALHGIDLDIASGELLGLLGPSGSGKTTLLRTIAGLETPNDGSIFFGEEDASARSVRERQVGFVFQSYALFRHMSVADNIGYGLRVRPRKTRPPAAAIAKRVADLLDMMQLSGFGERYPAQLSGGQRQRVALARALAVEPRVLLLDEPFGALDAQVRKDLRRWLRTLHDTTGHTTIFVTHDQDEALELSDRVALLHNGAIEQVGTPAEIYDTPRTPFTFGFIGEANRVDAELRDGAVLIGGHDTGLRQTSQTDGPGHLFFRPHHAALDPAGHGLPGTVTAVRQVGASSRADIAMANPAAHVEVDCARDTRPAVGTPTNVSIAQGHFFADP